MQLHQILEMGAVEFMEYCRMDPFEVLENPWQRRVLRSVLSKRDGLIGGLFPQDERETLDTLLENLIILKKNKQSLYQRWVQNTGGKERAISVPKKGLRMLLEGYLMGLIKKEEVHQNCHGGERGWSVKGSLETHLPCRSALSFDLENAFQEVSIERVFDLFYNALGRFSLDQDRIKIAGFFAMLCTVNYGEKRGLPQGSPASMPLFNRILYSLDCLLSRKANERGMQYSRWVDDFTLTSSVEENVGEFVGAVELVMGHSPVARGKIFFQDSEAVYLLGHKIVGGRIFKNSKKEKLEYKSTPLNFYDWFGENKTRGYKCWRD